MSANCYFSFGCCYSCVAGGGFDVGASSRNPDIFGLDFFDDRPLCFVLFLTLINFVMPPTLANSSSFLALNIHSVLSMIEEVHSCTPNLFIKCDVALYKVWKLKS